MTVAWSSNSVHGRRVLLNKTFLFREERCLLLCSESLDECCKQVYLRVSPNPPHSSANRTLAPRAVLVGVVLVVDASISHSPALCCSADFGVTTTVSHETHAIDHGKKMKDLYRARDPVPWSQRHVFG
jgi:hypothetical protein